MHLQINFPNMLADIYVEWEMNIVSRQNCSICGIILQSRVNSKYQLFTVVLSHNNSIKKDCLLKYSLHMMSFKNILFNFLERKLMLRKALVFSKLQTCALNFLLKYLFS